MNAITKAAIESLEKNSIKYTHLDVENENGLESFAVNFEGENAPDIKCMIIINEPANIVKFLSYNIVKVPKENTASMLELLNQMNMNYRFVKFCLDTDENIVRVETDMPVEAEYANQIFVNSILRLISIVDDAYPQLMKCTWS